MQTHFQRATLSMAHNDIVTSALPPLPGFQLPSAVTKFYEQVEQQQTKRGNEVAGGIAFGGMFADISAGRDPKDFDIYIAVPNLLTRLLARSEEQAHSYRERQEREDDLHAIIGYSFPHDISNMWLEPNRSDLFGAYLEFQTFYEHNERQILLDVKLGQKPLSLTDFLPYTGAPIMAVGMTLGAAKTEYGYHKDYPAHVKDGILCSDHASSSMLEKAERKNWAVLSKTEWAERSGQSGRRPDDPSPGFIPV